MPNSTDIVNCIINVEKQHATCTLDSYLLYNISFSHTVIKSCFRLAVVLKCIERNKHNSISK